MPGFVPSPNTIKVLVHFTLHGRPQLNVLHGLYTFAGPLNPNIAETMFAAAKANANGNNVFAQLATTFVFTGIGVIDIRGPNFPEIPSTGASEAGTNVALALPDQDSIVVTLRTGKTGRSFRGRIYSAGWTSAALAVDGSIDDVAATAALNWGIALQQGITAGGAQLAIRSPALPERPSKPGGNLPAKDYSIEPVTSLIVRDRIWDTNRRRLDTLHR